MTLSFLLAGLLIAPPAGAAPSAQPVEASDRWEWRHCTRLSTDAQLRSRPLSLEYSDVVEKAFAECAGQLKIVTDRQSPDDLQRLLDEQSKLIRQDVQMFYWDIVAHRI